MSRFRVIAAGSAVAVAGAVVLLLALGGGDSAILVPGSTLAQAATATERLPGASTSIDGKVQVGLLSKPIRFRLHGIQNTRQRSAYLVGAYEDLPKKVPGQSSNGTIPVESITIIPHVYMKSRLFAAQLPPGKPWLDIDLAKTGRKLGIGDPTQIASTDPSQSLQALRALSSRVEQVGSERVRGVPTTHYRAKVDLHRLPAVAAPENRAAAKRSAERLIKLIGTDSYPLEVWVDKHRLVRRMRIVMDMTIQGRSFRQELTIELYDFGPKRKVGPPPADETWDASLLSGP